MHFEHSWRRRRWMPKWGRKWRKKTFGGFGPKKIDNFCDWRRKARRGDWKEERRRQRWPTTKIEAKQICGGGSDLCENNKFKSNYSFIWRFPRPKQLFHRKFLAEWAHQSNPPMFIQRANLPIKMVAAVAKIIEREWEWFEAIWSEQFHWVI